MMDMNGMANMSGTQGMAGMPGMADPNAVAGLGGGFNSFLGGLLNLAIDILVILIVVGLVVAAVVWIKRYVLGGELLAVQPKTACAHCGQILRSDWNACPKCGQPKPTVVNGAPQTA